MMDFPQISSQNPSTGISGGLRNRRYRRHRCSFSSASYDEAVDVAGNDTDWPALGHDGANTGYNPNARSPRSGSKVKWKTPIGMTFGPLVVAGDTLYVGDDAGKVYGIKLAAEPESPESDSVRFAGSATSVPASDRNSP